MEEIHIYTNDANQRLDKFLQKSFPSLPKSKMYKAIRNKKIKVNRKRCTFNQILNEGDTILLFLPPEFLVQKTHKVQRSKPLNIVYETEDIVVIYKPRGLLSQSSVANEDCVVERLRWYLYEKGEYQLDEHSFSPTICNRLDRNTTGLVLAAKNANALRTLNDAIAKRAIRKYYRAIVEGHLDRESFEINAYLKKEQTKAHISDTEREGYKPVGMKVTVLEERVDSTMIEVELYTGRFHQIRALMAHLGHPLVGDQKYGSSIHTNYFLEAYKLDLSNVNLPLSKTCIEI